tara:strand:+ start:172 stop:975 length:804 start_codon:yes stop_codon:yes gene_type:complete
MRFDESGCADNNFMRELTEGDEGQFYSRVWEAIVYDRLASNRWSLRATQAGPDFRVDTEFGLVQIEAVVPAPQGIPSEWLADPEPFKVLTHPHEAILLRWTSAISAKSTKQLLDIEKKAADSDAPFVIALNSCRLSRMREDFGISQWPYAVEAVFPIGPVAVSLNRTTLESSEAYQSQRFAITNKNGAEIPTTIFTDPKNAHISAIVGASALFEPAANEGSNPATVSFVTVNNPYARNPLPKGWLPNALEYYAEIDSAGDLLLSRPS